MSGLSSMRLMEKRRAAGSTRSQRSTSSERRSTLPASCLLLILQMISEILLSGLSLLSILLLFCSTYIGMILRGDHKQAASVHSGEQLFWWIRLKWPVSALLCFCILRRVRTRLLIFRHNFFLAQCLFHAKRCYLLHVPAPEKDTVARNRLRNS
jgi:hypothetical protein